MVLHSIISHSIVYHKIERMGEGLHKKSRLSEALCRWKPSQALARQGRVAAPSVCFAAACILLAAVPTAPPCFRRWRRSSLLLPKGEPLACRSGFVWTSKVCMFLKQECPATKVNSCLTMNVCSEAAVLYSRALSFAGYYTSAVRRKWPGLPRAPPLGELSRRRRD